MSEISLTGLAGAHPLGALAAFGLLRCCEETDSFRGARLGWKQNPDWFAFLETNATQDAESLVAALVTRQHQRATALELNWARIIKTDPAQYLKAASVSADELTQGRRCCADFLAAFASELATTDDGKLAPTAFSMTSGRQEFLKEARTLADRLAKGIKIGRRKKSPEEMFREALFGPWRYEDPQHSLGLDPAAERLHALRAKSPTKESSEGVTAAVWLAFEAMPLFPCFLSRGSLATTGFHIEGATWRDRTTWLTWPVWRQPVPLDTVRSLLSLAELHQARPPLQALRERGIEAVFRSERYRVKSQGAYFILRQAFPCG
jgi:hypothetical protein